MSFSSPNVSLEAISDQEEAEYYLVSLSQRVNDHLSALLKVTNLMTSEVVEMFRPKRPPKLKVDTRLLQKDKTKPEKLMQSSPSLTSVSPPTTLMSTPLISSAVTSSPTLFSTVSAADVYSQYISKLPLIAQPNFVHMAHQPLGTGMGIFYQMPISPLLLDTSMTGVSQTNI